MRWGCCLLAAAALPLAGADVDALIAAHAASVRAVLANVTACADGGCSAAWARREAAWRAAEAAADDARVAWHRHLFGDFLPRSTGPVQVKPNVHGFSVRKKVEGTFCAHDYFEPTYACGTSQRLPAGVGDGPKWFCALGASSTPRRVVSVGSAFDDRFEAAAAAEGAAPYVVDPSLEKSRGAAAVAAFRARVEAYGGRLNATVGVGSGVWNYRKSSFTLVPLAALLADAYPDADAPLALAGLKIDVEGAEFEALAEVASLCRARALKVDQLWVEVHLSLGRKAGEVYRLLHGLLHCNLMLFHKEVNTWGCDNRCAEYAFVSAAHARRVFEAEHAPG